MSMKSREWKDKEKIKTQVGLDVDIERESQRDPNTLRILDERGKDIAPEHWEYGGVVCTYLYKAKHQNSIAFKHIVRSNMLNADIIPHLIQDLYIDLKARAKNYADKLIDMKDKVIHDLDLKSKS